MIEPRTSPAEAAPQAPASALWPAARSQELILLWRIGGSPAELAHFFSATSSGIYARVRTLRRLGHSLGARRAAGADEQRRSLVRRKDGPASRKCLCCNRSFHSSHSGNRLCVECLDSGLF
jgi:hypothetical protein